MVMKTIRITLAIVIKTGVNIDVVDTDSDNNISNFNDSGNVNNEDSNNSILESKKLR